MLKPGGAIVTIYEVPAKYVEPFCERKRMLDDVIFSSRFTENGTVVVTVMF